MNRFLRNWGLVICVLAVATFLRLYRISSVPPSPSLDEVSIGYNAYSILKTGGDEYGNKFPILLRAYDDWRPALYVYFVIPFVWILGLTVTAVRLPSVLFSIISVFVVYLLAKEIFTDEKISWKIKEAIIDPPLIIALLLAISPWHIYISRLGHEVNPGLAFIIFGLYLFFHALNHKDKGIFLVGSSIFFALSFYTYQSEKIVVPILMALLAIIFRKKVWFMKEHAIVAVIVGVIISTPIFFSSLSPEARIRFNATSAFVNNPLYVQGSGQLVKALEQRDVIGIVVNNRRITTLRIFFENYFSHFNPRWLFFGGDQEAHKVPGLGLLYPWEAPLILLGLVFVFRKFSFPIAVFLLGWLLTAPLAASFTTQTPHAMRSYTFLPVWQFFSAMGLFSLLYLFRRFGNVLFFVFIIFVTVGIQQFYVQYFYAFPKLQSGSFQYALAKVIPYIIENQDTYQRVIFSNESNLYQSYMFFLFFTQYNPNTYHMQGGTKSGGFAQTHVFGKFEFRPIRWDKEQKQGKNLYVGNISDFPQNISPVFMSSNLDGIPAIYLVNK